MKHVEYIQSFATCCFLAIRLGHFCIIVCMLEHRTEARARITILTIWLDDFQETVQTHLPPLGELSKTVTRAVLRR